MRPRRPPGAGPRPRWARRRSPRRPRRRRRNPSPARPMRSARRRGHRRGGALRRPGWSLLGLIRMRGLVLGRVVVQLLVLGLVAAGRGLGLVLGGLLGLLAPGQRLLLGLFGRDGLVIG